MIILNQVTALSPLPDMVKQDHRIVLCVYEQWKGNPSPRMNTASEIFCLLNKKLGGRKSRKSLSIILTIIY